MTTKEQAEVRRDPYGVHILRRDTARALEPRKGMVVGLPKVVIDASHAAHALAAYDALKAENDALAASEQRLAEALEECAEHFKTLREAGVHVWPNHPLNPEKRIAEALAARKVEA